MTHPDPGDLEGGLEEVLRFVDVPEGPWTPPRTASPFEGAHALLVVRGLLLADLRLDRGGATELVGPGDLLRAWPGEDELVPFASGIVVAEAARVAVLDDGLTEVVRRWPGVGARLIVQSAIRHRRQAQHRAASQLPRVEDRLLALFWLLAERWGRVGHGGVVLPLALTHELLGRLVGARRPTITMAIGQLVDEGHIRRRADRSVVLLPASRRALVPAEGPASKTIDVELVEGPAAEPQPLVPSPPRRARRPVSLAEEVEHQRRQAEVLRRSHDRALERSRTVVEASRLAVEQSRARRGAAAAAAAVATGARPGALTPRRG